MCLFSPCIYFSLYIGPRLKVLRPCILLNLKPNLYYKANYSWIPTWLLSIE
jgi:hypothetical protein